MPSRGLALDVQRWLAPREAILGRPICPSQTMSAGPQPCSRPLLIGQPVLLQDFLIRRHYAGLQSPLAVRQQALARSPGPVEIGRTPRHSSADKAAAGHRDPGTK